MDSEKDRIKCPECGGWNTPSNKFCSHCFQLIVDNSVAEEEKEVDKQKVFMEFNKLLKSNSLDDSLVAVAEKFNLKLSTINKWYVNDNWQKKVDGLLKLQRLRGEAYDYLKNIDLDKTTLDDAFEEVSHQIKVKKSQIEKWYNRYDWEEKLKSGEDISNESSTNADESSASVKDESSTETPDKASTDESSTDDSDNALAVESSTDNPDENSDDEEKIKKPSIEKKAFAEFNTVIKSNSLEEAFELVANKFELQLSEVNKWYTNNNWQEKVDKLERLRAKRDEASAKLVEFVLNDMDLDEAFDKVSEDLKIKRSNIEKWFDKYGWQEKINVEKEKLAKIAEEEFKKEQERLAELKRKEDERKRIAQEAFDKEKAMANSKLDLFDKAIEKNLVNLKDGVIYHTISKLACKIEKVSDEERRYDFGLFRSNFDSKIILRYKMRKGIHDDFNDLSSNFRFDGDKVILKLNIRYIEESSSFDVDESSKFQYLKNNFDITPSENRKIHEKYYFDVCLGDYNEDEFYRNFARLLEIIEFSPKMEKYARALDVKVSHDFMDDFESQKLEELEGKKDEVFETLKELMSNGKSKDDAITSAYRKYDIAKKIILNWYEEDKWALELENNES